MSDLWTSVPKVSVVIPTYNRSALLAKLLGQLAAQRLPRNSFEVIVADDGSSDDTKDVVVSFTDRLRIKYHFQEDLGFRAAIARNTGARLAEARLLVFLDSGALVGPDFLAHHLALHSEGPPRAVVGYQYGYNPESAMPELAAILDQYDPVEAVARYGGDPAFLDVRHEALVECGFDLHKRAVPWMFFWTGNCSISRDDFWTIGGFDEQFHGWGVEDLEFAYRVFHHGLLFHFETRAWTIESPHDRNIEANWANFARNIGQFLDKHREPVVEIGWALVTNQQLWTWEEDYQQLLDVRRQVRDVTVHDELDRVARDLPPGRRVAVIGAGAETPDSLPDAVLIDFDLEALDRALAGSRHTGQHAVGLRTSLADQSVDTVVLTSRLAGLWRRWGADLLVEARRIGRDIRVTGGLDDTPTTREEAT